MGVKVRRMEVKGVGEAEKEGEGEAEVEPLPPPPTPPPTHTRPANQPSPPSLSPFRNGALN